MHLGAFAGIWFYALPFLFSIAVSCGIVLSAWFSFRRYVFLRSSSSIVSMVSDAEGEWTLVLANGEREVVQLVRAVVLPPWWISMTFQGGSRHWPITVVLLPDSIDSTSFRRLRAKLMRGLNFENLAE